MRWLVLFSLLLISATPYRGSGRVPRDGRCSSRDGSCGSTAPVASFNLFPVSNAGVGAECAGTVPTGALGETVTFTRVGGQTCTKADGTVVKLTANQPAVETLTGRALSDGSTLTGSQLGMLDEAASTNMLIQSEALENAAWSTNSNGVALPTVTANAGVAPDGTTTAERIQVPATVGGQYSQIFNTTGFTGDTVATTCSFYVISNAPQSGTFDASVSDGSARSTIACSYNPLSWTRCVLPPVALSNVANASFIGFGSEAVNSGDGALGAAADVFVWGTQCENNTFPTSYIPTTTVAVTRSATTWTVNTTTFGTPVTSASGCVGMDAYFSKWGTNTVTQYSCGFSGGASGSRVPYEARLAANDYELRIFDGTNQNSNTANNGPTGYNSSLQSVLAWFKTAGPINSTGLGGTGTSQNTYNNAAIAAAGAGGVYTLGHTGAGCGSNAVAWLTRIRMDTDSTGAKCR